MRIKINQLAHNLTATWLASWLLLLCMSASSAFAAPSYTLQQVIDMAFKEHPSVRVTRAQEDAAIANVTTAKSFINPEIEMGAGPSRYRTGTNDTRNNWGVALSQPLEFSDVRSARREIAESNDIISPLYGKILEVFIKENQLIKVGDPLLVIESMKSENHILSHRDARVKKIATKVGAQVTDRMPLIYLED